MTADVKKCAVVVSNEDKFNPGKFQMEVGRKWPTDPRPVYVPWRRDLEGRLLGCKHGESNRKGQITSR